MNLNVQRERPLSYPGDFSPSYSPGYIVSLTEQPDQFCLTSPPTPRSHPRGEEFAGSTSLSRLLSKSAFQGPAQTPGPSESLAENSFLLLSI